MVYQIVKDDRPRLLGTTGVPFLPNAKGAKGAKGARSS
jgi:hypothetical protein